MSEAWTTSETAKPVILQSARARAWRRPCLAWTAEEDEALRRLYPDYNALQRRLSSRTLYAIKNRAALLHLRKRRHVWTQIEVTRLKRLYSQRRASDEQLREAFPGMTLDQVRCKARALGFARERPAPKVLGIAVLDAVRQRAHDEGMSLRDLDVVSGTHRYFQASLRRLVWKHVAAGVEALGGRLVPSWDEDASPARDALIMARPLRSAA